MNTCKTCSANCTGEYCFRHKPRKPMQTRTRLQAKKRIKRVGKLGRRYIELRKLYFTINPGPDYYCAYCLYVGIDEPLAQQHVQLEHYLTKNHRQDLRFDLSNIVLSCATHNKQKGHLDGPEFLQILDKQKEGIYGID
jgi:hypothetical protein